MLITVIFFSEFNGGYCESVREEMGNSAGKCTKTAFPRYYILLLLSECMMCTSVMDPLEPLI